MLMGMCSILAFSLLVQMAFYNTVCRCPRIASSAVAYLSPMIGRIKLAIIFGLSMRCLDLRVECWIYAILKCKVTFDQIRHEASILASEGGHN
jgi:hypothetical protein